MPQEIQLKVGQEHAFSLNSNPTTGYDWEFKVEEPSIADVGQADFNSSGEEGVCGAGGKTNYTIVGKSPGKVQIKFEYKRSWEDYADYKIIYNVTVQ